jgi:predicted enzyme related to lactoylglutathione lyase
MSNQSSKFAIQPILSTNDIERLSSFYITLFGAEEHMRVPGKKGPFFVTLQLGEASLGLVAHKRGADAPAGRVAVAVFVENVDDLLPRVGPAGGNVLGPANDMPWGHRSLTSPTRTATRSTSPSSSECQAASNRRAIAASRLVHAPAVRRL